VFGAYETDDSIFIILELVYGGDLLDEMIKLGEEFPEDRARIIFIQIFKAVQYLHSMGIVHRDLKPENILLVSKKDDRIKLTDFGLSRIVGEGSFMKTICGTPMYVAPEVIENMGQKTAKGYGKAVDVWSLGVILYMLLCGEPPFDQRKPTPILEQVKKGVYSMPEDLRQTLSPVSQDLVSQLLTVDPQKRITIDRIGHHQWITGDQKLGPRISRQGASLHDALRQVSLLSGDSEKMSPASGDPLVPDSTFTPAARGALSLNVPTPHASVGSVTPKAKDKRMFFPDKNQVLLTPRVSPMPAPKVSPPA